MKRMIVWIMMILLTNSIFAAAPFEKVIRINKDQITASSQLLGIETYLGEKFTKTDLKGAKRSLLKKQPIELKNGQMIDQIEIAYLLVKQSTIKHKTK